MKLRVISFLLALLTSRALFAQVDVLTAQYDLNRTSSNMQETILNRANVNSAQFGKLFTRSVDAPFYASRLIVTNFNVPGVGVGDLVHVATLGNSVYAFDADDPNANAPYWSVNLGAYPFDLGSRQFLTGSATVGTLLPFRAGGMTISSNGSAAGTGIVWATTAAQNALVPAMPGTLRAYNANDITQELYDSDQNPCRDSMGTFVKMSTPIVANGKVYVNTQSNTIPVYGLLPTSGTVQVTVGASVNGPTVTVDGGAPCAGSQGFNWVLGSTHTLSTSPTQSGGTGTQFVWQNWSDDSAISHTVTANALTTNCMANFKTQYLLTTQVPQAGSGSISPPTSFFDSSSSVQVTAAVNTSFTTFTGFSGALIGTTNPEFLIMSGPLNVTGNFQYAAGTTSFVTGFALNQPALRNAATLTVLPASTNYVTSANLGTLRKNFSGWVGMSVTVGDTPLTVTALGRIDVAGNTGSHTLQIVNANGTSVTGGSVTISMAGGIAGSFVYGSLASPVTLNANTTYYIVSQETLGGDQWYDINTMIQTTNVGAETTGIWSPDGITYDAYGSPDESYGPVNFLYTPATSASFVTGVLPGTVRNDFSGWVGGDITTGSSAVQVTQLGRYVVAGNTGTHTVKLVNASTGQDMVGGSVTVNLEGGQAGTFVYSSLASPITLSVNTTYYLVSQEVAGGDQWYDINTTIQTTNVASETAGAWSPDGVTYNMNGSSDESYGPLDFVYATGSVATAPACTKPLAIGAFTVCNEAASSLNGSAATISTSLTPSTGNGVFVIGLICTNNASPLCSGTPAQTATISDNVNSPETCFTASPNTPYLSLDTTIPDEIELWAWYCPSIPSGVNAFTVNFSGAGYFPEIDVVEVESGGLATTNYFESVDNVNWGVTGTTTTVTTNGSTSKYNDLIVGMTETCGGDVPQSPGTGYIAILRNSPQPGHIVEAMAVTNPGTYIATSTWSSSAPTNCSGGSGNNDSWYGIIVPLIGASQPNTGQTAPAITSTNSTTFTVGTAGSFTVTTTGTPTPTLSANIPAALSGQITFTDNGNGTGTLAGTATTTAGSPFTITFTATNSVTSVQQTFMLTVTGGGEGGSTAFITQYGETQNNPEYRSNFTGLVGMSLTVGSSPLTVTSLGRLCIAANSGTHTVEIVNTSNQVVGSVSVNLAGCTAGQFVYTALSSSITLQANTTYYLASQETNGGDQWLNYSGVASTNVATVNSAEYLYGGWTPIGSANQSYVPPNFLYSTSSP